MTISRSCGCSRRLSKNTDKDPGYIKSYPPGVRENGGQYTHASTWLVIALAKLGRAGDAWRAFSMLNPVNHARDKESAETYRVEPYAVAADIYSEGDRAGRGGWTWYTGSAGWLYRAGVEAILGIRRQGEELHVEPCLPPEWPGFTATMRFGAATYTITVERGEPSASIDGQPASLPIKIAADGEHTLHIRVATMT